MYSDSPRLCFVPSAFEENRFKFFHIYIFEATVSFQEISILVGVETIGPEHDFDEKVGFYKISQDFKDDLHHT